MKKSNLFEKDYTVLWISLKITVIVMSVFLMGAMLGDATAMPVEYALGATQEQVKESSNITLFQQIGWWWIIITLTIYSFSFIMLNYLENIHGDGVFCIQYKRDYNGRLIRKNTIKTIQEERKNLINSL